MKKQSENKFWEEKITQFSHQKSFPENNFWVFHKLSEFIIEV